jgi:ketosteroid isomerase-like protein
MTDSSEPALRPVHEFYRRADAGDPSLLELFTDDVEFWFPKHGVGVGPEAFNDFVNGFGKNVAQIAHDVGSLSFVVSGDTVVVEGLTSGRTQDGNRWCGGKTPGGRFCSVFRLREGCIARMYVYLDPDYTGRDVEGFAWEHLEGRRW